MLVIISPAKKLDMKTLNGVQQTEPLFSSDTKELVSLMRCLDVNGLKSLMGLSDSLARLNADRFTKFGSQQKKPAVLAFAGDTYKGLEASTLEPESMAWAQNHLRILSGLYGILRPLDAIEPYRLEMGSRVKTEMGKSLYEFWGTKLADNINAQLLATKSKVVLNCASQEYFGAIDLKKLAGTVITPVFLENKNGSNKIVSFFAKGRGRDGTLCHRESSKRS